jgi:hypothetical protein
METGIIVKNSDFRARVFKPLFCKLLAIYLVGPSLCQVRGWTSSTPPASG